jgi:saccharopine dehydrogenase-like NADP-dependent oxidoreductase
MNDIVVVGAGKIGSTIARLLSGANDYRVLVVDRSADQLGLIETSKRVKTGLMEITDAALDQKLQGCYAVLSAAPFHLTTLIARAASRSGVHYLDLTEDVRSTKEIRAIAASAHRLPAAMRPGAGLRLDRRP